MRRRLSLLLGLVLIALLLTELGLRLTTDLGRPLLYVAHPQIEYMLRPDQDLTRDGKRLLVNAQGMRSAALPKPGTTPITLVMGDSVVNGGDWTDHAALATTRASRVDSPRFYANISANSWGPANLLAYLETNGDFGADSAVIVLNAYDLDDVPEFLPRLSRDYPTARPVSVMATALRHHVLPWFVPNILRKLLEPVPEPTSVIDSGGAKLALWQLLQNLAERNISTCVLGHPHSGVPEAVDIEGLNIIRQIATYAGATYLPLATIYATVTLRNHEGLYRDAIHLNETGQIALAQAILQCQKMLAR